MGIRSYTVIWLFILSLLSYEYFCLNFNPEGSLLRQWDPTLVADPGRRLSLWLGWAGIIVMLLMNLYIVRKRTRLFNRLGSLAAWLELHIFCGLVGPTFILFHSNFKVRGLVAISFWSMMVSASSGVVGRYFYVQLLQRRKDTEEDAAHWEAAFKKMQAASSPPVADATIAALKERALRYVGVGAGAVAADGSLSVGALQVFVASLVGDIRLLFGLPETAEGMPKSSRMILKNYALSKRQALFLEPFRNLLGYWHTFHTPFAIFMYGAAVIHIATALLLGVHK